MQIRIKKFETLPDVRGDSTIDFETASAACDLLCKTMTLSRVVEKSHKWHRKSLVFGVELCDVDADLPGNERFG